jgi:hypothetical protein
MKCKKMTALYDGKNQQTEQGTMAAESRTGLKGCRLPAEAQQSPEQPEPVPGPVQPPGAPNFVLLITIN